VRYDPCALPLMLGGAATISRVLLDEDKKLHVLRTYHFIRQRSLPQHQERQMTGAGEHVCSERSACASGYSHNESTNVFRSESTGCSAESV
jgi:hypothetical protein